MNCPNCHVKIKWHQIAFAAFPVWIKCESCGAKLVGNSYIKIQACLVIFLGAVMGAGVASLSVQTHLKLLFFVIGVLVITAPNIYLSMLNGKYSIK